MSTFAKKILCSLFLLLPLGAVLYFWSLDQWVTIESVESKTEDQKAVFNKIKFNSSHNLDSWLMKQSHDGIHGTEWDDLEIRVDKSKSPFEVTFHQYKNGRESEYRASCYLCHANGPRLIRPEFESKQAPINLKKRVLIWALNLRIKTYPRMITKTNDAIKRVVPLRYMGKLESTPLTVKTCTYCHNAETFWGRGELKRQQLETIIHLVDSKQMPPWPFKLDQKEQEQLDQYLRGF